MFLKSIFDSENIKYYVHNDNFGSLQLGPSIELFNAKTIYINESDKIEAKELLEAYLEEQKVETIETEPNKPKSLFKKLRMIIEALLFTWFIPDEDRYKIRKNKNNH